MQIVWDFGVGVEEYVQEFVCVVFPMLLECPCCGAGVRLERHGYYFRNVLARAGEYRVAIARYLCRSCRRTVSLVPCFLLPRFQRSKEVILESLREVLLRRRFVPYRQIAEFYRRRLLRNVNAIAAALRDMGWGEVLSKDEMAMKLVDRLSALTVLDWAVRYSQLSSRVLGNFMALSL